jgi:hypothetical protein
MRTQNFIRFSQGQRRDGKCFTMFTFPGRVLRKIYLALAEGNVDWKIFVSAGVYI